MRSRGSGQLVRRLRSYPTVAMLESRIRSWLSRGPKRKVIVDDSSQLHKAPAVHFDWPPGVKKPHVGLVVDPGTTPYWTKFRRFLEFNSIPYVMYNIHESTWLEVADGIDAVVWRVGSAPVELEVARRKIFMLEKVLGKVCFPSFDAVVLYEDKILQYEMLRQKGFPVIDTFISHDFDEVLAAVGQLQYPVVSKVVPGSASLGVSMIRSPRNALKLARQSFALAGRATYWPYLRQKDYVFLQKFEPNDGYDLRVLVIGDNIFGYYRAVPKYDFRASGMDEVEKRDLPTDAMDLAREVAKSIDVEMLAVDFLRRRNGELRIIEISSFIRVDTPEQLHVNGIPGMYVYKDGRYVFKPGRVWPQELALAEFFRRRWIDRLEQSK